MSRYGRVPSSQHPAQLRRRAAGDDGHEKLALAQLSESESVGEQDVLAEQVGFRAAVPLSLIILMRLTLPSMPPEL